MRIGKKKRAQRESRDDQSCLGGIRYNRAQWNQVSRGNRERERERIRAEGDKWVKTWREKAVRTSWDALSTRRTGQISGERAGAPLEKRRMKVDGGGLDFSSRHAKRAN